MARGKEFPLFMALKAVDRATAPMRSFSKKIEKTFAPLKKLNNKMQMRLEAMGLSKITKSLGGVSTAFGGVIKQASKLGKRLGIIFGAASAAIGFLVKKTADYGDAIWKTSQKIGISARAWQEFVYAADQSGVSQESLSTSLRTLNKNIVAAANGNKSMAAWFKRAGVSIRDANGKIKSADTVLTELAGKLEKVPDGAKKTAMMMALVGQAGADLVPMLNAGKKGIEELRNEAHTLGLVLSDEDLQAAEAFNSNLSRLWKTIQGIARYIGSLLIPIFDDVVVSLKDWILANRELIQSKVKEWIDKLRERLPELKKRFFEAAEKVKNFFVKIAENLDKIGGLSGALKILGLIIAGPLLLSIGALIKAFAILGAVMLTNPLGIMIVGMAVAGLAIKAFVNFIRKNWDTIWSVISAAGKAIHSVLIHLFDPGKLLGLLNKWIEVFTGINLFETGKRIIDSLLNGLKSSWETVKKWFSGAAKLIPDFLKSGGRGDQPAPGNGQSDTVPMSTPKRVLQHSRQRQNMTTVTKREEIKQEASVKVKFDNLPKGARVTTEKNDGVDMNLDMGYAYTP